MSPQSTTKQKKWLVIGASSFGTMFEWYDFFLYGALAGYIAQHFFSGVNDATAFIFALAAFAAGFIVRPLGALVFGRIGDIVGRKNTFLVTMGIMGLSTFCVGILPGYDTLGVLAPAILILLRLLQGLAIGGEYGGAAIYVAEHAPSNKRGLHTSWIQTTAAFGLLLSLIVIMVTRTTMPDETFSTWGWRIPFLLSIFLLGISLWIRIKLNESPVFQKMKSEGTTSKAPLAESFLNLPNLKIVLIALFGCVAGQAVTFYAGTFYVLFYLERTLKVDGLTANTLVAIALVLSAPLYLLFGWLSDRIGRKPIIMLGLLLAVLTYFPAFKALTQAANPALATAQTLSPVSVIANPLECSFQFDPVGKNKFNKSSCDIAKAHLARSGISYKSIYAEPGIIAQIQIGNKIINAPDPKTIDAGDLIETSDTFKRSVDALLYESGYPPKADENSINKLAVVSIIVFLMMITTMCYGPMAALLVELFDAKIRYTSMSLPYHIGNGWFGGFLPTTAFAIVAATGNIYNGLWYPVIIAAGSLLIGLIFLPETKGKNVN